MPALDTELLCIICFYNIAEGSQRFLAFSKHLRHCNVYTYDGFDWVLLEFDSTGIKTRVVNINRVDKFINRLKTIPSISAIMVLNVYKRKSVRWMPLWGRSCNEICRYASGADTGLTFNPVHLYKKLLKYNNKRNFKILTTWSAQGWDLAEIRSRMIERMSYWISKWLKQKPKDSRSENHTLINK